MTWFCLHRLQCVSKQEMWQLLQALQHGNQRVMHQLVLAVISKRQETGRGLSLAHTIVVLPSERTSCCGCRNVQLPVVCRKRCNGGKRHTTSAKAVAAAETLLRGTCNYLWPCCAYKHFGCDERLLGSGDKAHYKCKSCCGCRNAPPETCP